MTTTQESAQETVSPQAPEPRGWFRSYRSDQGRHARMAAFWAMVFFLVFGCRFMNDLLIQSPALREPLGGIRIPVVGVSLSPAFLISFGVFVVCLLAVVRWQQRPRVADLLIETEAELRKVTWPKGSEVWNSAIIVIVFVVLLGIFLAATDAVLFRVMRYLILGPGVES
jgi:preprotein translocase SecE subunit